MEMELKVLGRELREVGIERVEEEEGDFGEKKSLWLREMKEAEVAQHAIWKRERDNDTLFSSILFC